MGIRLFVVFACISQSLAHEKSLRVVPSHPDGTGGLLPIGQTALVLSIIIFASGLWLTALTYQVAISIKTSTSQGPYSLSEALMFYLLWAGYLFIGPLVFFLPLVPLHGIMVRAKREYLMSAEHLYRKVDEVHRQHIREGKVALDTLRDQNAVAAAMERASAMAVWPFDKATLRRFTGLLVSPLLPIIVERATNTFLH